MIGFFHLNLVIARESVHEAQKLVSCGIYPREWTIVFGASLIEVHKVYAHPSFSIGLFNHDEVCQLVGIVHFSDEICLKQLLNFLSNGFVPLLSEYSFLLPDWGK